LQVGNALKDIHIKITLQEYIISAVARAVVVSFGYTRRRKKIVVNVRIQIVLKYAV